VSDHREGILARALAELRRPVRLAPTLDARVMAAVAAEPASWARVPRADGAVAWLTRPRTLRLSPLGALAAAAVVTLLWWRPWTHPAVPSHSVPAEIQFVFVDPGASTVAVVGDFNDWDTLAHPLSRAAPGGLWTVNVPLLPGRHRYAFVVDGQHWTPDPAAPRAAGDDFDTPSSVVTVGGDS
jgi:hypothetical protein